MLLGNRGNETETKTHYGRGSGRATTSAFAIPNMRRGTIPEIHTGIRVFSKREQTIDLAPSFHST
jgi:hypothetical protein